MQVMAIKSKVQICSSITTETDRASEAACRPYWVFRVEANNDFLKEILSAMPAVHPYSY